MQAQLLRKESRMWEFVDSIEAVRYKDNSFSELLSDIQGVKEQGVLKCWSAVVRFSACYVIKGW